MPVPATPLSQDPYASYQAAALAALAAARQQKANLEWAGAVLREATKNGSYDYRYTIPQQGSNRHFNLALTFPKADSIAALYHTHPDIGEGSLGVLFSPNDVTVANALKVPSYIWSAYDGKDRVYIPGKSKLRYSEEANGEASPGTVVQTPQSMLANTRP